VKKIALKGVVWLNKFAFLTSRELQRALHGQCITWTIHSDERGIVKAGVSQCTLEVIPSIVIFKVDHSLGLEVTQSYIPMVFNAQQNQSETFVTS
jgi:hypothetical protein